MKLTLWDEQRLEAEGREPGHSGALVSAGTSSILLQLVSQGTVFPFSSL